MRLLRIITSPYKSSLPWPAFRRHSSFQSGSSHPTQPRTIGTTPMSSYHATRLAPPCVPPSCHMATELGARLP
ncbi:hypothetical protein BDV11DRAFT_177305 [Aspergillus similis]